MTLLLTMALAADCAEPTTNGQVASELQAALLSFAVMDDEAFVASTDRAFLLVDCLGESATPQLAASLHRVKGVRALFDGREDAARASLAAALALEPDHTLPETLAPTGGKLDQLYQRARGERADRIPHEVAADLVVDGTHQSTVPLGPYLLQVASGGSITWSRWSAGGRPEVPADRLPPGSVAVVPEPVPEEPEPVAHVAPVVPMPAPQPVAPEPFTASPAPPPENKGKGLLWAGVASGGVAAALYGTSIAGRMSYQNNPTAGTAGLTNGAFIGSVGTAVVSGGLFTAYAVTR